MKKILFIAAAALALTLVSCSKERQCQCVTTDIVDDGTLKLLTIDGGMSCDAITVMGFEEHRQDPDNGQHILTHTEMHSVKCREYGK